MLRQSPTGRDDFHLHPVGGIPTMLGDEPLDGVNVFRRLRRELKRRIHPCGRSRSARLCRRISIAASPSSSSPRSA
jgi:hypothetical protein